MLILDERRASAPPLLALGIPRTPPIAAPRRSGEAQGRTARRARRRHADPPARRRARRRLSIGRPRFLDAGRAAQGARTAARCRRFRSASTTPDSTSPRISATVVRHLRHRATTTCSARSTTSPRDFPRTISHSESPVLRTAPAPMQHAVGPGARATDVKVVLTGEGADEVLGGYDIFKESKVRQFWAQQPELDAGARGCSKRLYPYLDLTSEQSAAYLKEFFGVGLSNPDDPVFLAPAALGDHRAVQAVLVGRLSRAQVDGDAIATPARVVAAESSRAGIRSTAASTSKRRRCCRATCCRRRAIACSCRTRSRGDSRSSTIA